MKTNSWKPDSKTKAILKQGFMRDRINYKEEGKMKNKQAVLVYQGGIANVFEVDCFNLAPYGREAKRLLRHAFSPCEFFARGLQKAGYSVKVLGCNMAGDIVDQKWTDNLEELPFSDKFVKCNENNTLL